MLETVFFWYVVLQPNLVVASILDGVFESGSIGDMKTRFVIFMSFTSFTVFWGQMCPPTLFRTIWFFGGQMHPTASDLCFQDQRVP